MHTQILPVYLSEMLGVPAVPDYNFEVFRRDAQAGAEEEGCPGREEAAHSRHYLVV